MKQMTNRLLGITRVSGLALVVSIVLMPVLLHAGELEENQVLKAVETWVRYETADARPEAVIASMQPWIDNGKITAYIAHLEDGGFCICGADDRVLPVYFYSPKGVFDEEMEDYLYILWEIGVRKAYLETTARSPTGASAMIAEALADRSTYWQQLISGTPVSRLRVDAEMDAPPNTLILDMTSRWHQGSPFNDLCPNLTPGANEHVAVGCVATSMAQIMNYWQWPASGVSSGSQDYNYSWRTNWDQTPLPVNPRPDLGVTSWTWRQGRLEWTSNNGGQLRMTGYWDHSLYLSARRIKEDDTAYLNALETLWDRMPRASTPNNVNFALASYNWAIMPDVGVEPPGAGELEAAKLSYHAGVAVEMNWGVDGSSSNNGKAVSALEAYFRYDPDGFISSPSASQIVEEIQWMRPAFMDGCRDADGGCHSWVVMGYNLAIPPDPHQFYINLGQGGGSEGWYTFDDMGGFKLIKEQGIHVAPLSVKFVGAANTGDGSPDDPYIDIDEARIEAPEHSTLIFKAGSTNTFAGSQLILDRPMTLKGHNITIE